MFERLKNVVGSSSDLEAQGITNDRSGAAAADVCLSF